MDYLPRRRLTPRLPLNTRSSSLLSLLLKKNPFLRFTPLFFNSERVQSLQQSPGSDLVVPISIRPLIAPQSSSL
ncbi:hypothetical protein COLO4_03708 [Corchorus olitorius]|uniref:Uncharacterized protein n=1 Tax=Corchorus olitorius TaxID=93759 RepID=A0A1R3KXD3_9ROSI|nr:hypothetical protein COLO4_03708 [Corchorus olitorius]